VKATVLYALYINNLATKYLLGIQQTNNDLEVLGTNMDSEIFTIPIALDIVPASNTTSYSAPMFRIAATIYDLEADEPGVCIVDQSQATQLHYTAKTVAICPGYDLFSIIDRV
jgi:hypothetical protein